MRQFLVRNEMVPGITQDSGCPGISDLDSTLACEQPLQVAEKQSPRSELLPQQRRGLSKQQPVLGQV